MKFYIRRAVVKNSVGTGDEEIFLMFEAGDFSKPTLLTKLDAEHLLDQLANELNLEVGRREVER